MSKTLQSSGIFSTKMINQNPKWAELVSATLVTAYTLEETWDKDKNEYFTWALDISTRDQLVWHKNNIREEYLELLDKLIRRGFLGSVAHIENLKAAVDVAQGELFLTDDLVDKIEPQWERS